MCVLYIILYLCVRLVTSIIVHRLHGGLSGNAGLQSVACSYWLRLKFENRTRKMPSDHGEGKKQKKLRMLAGRHTQTAISGSDWESQEIQPRRSVTSLYKSEPFLQMLRRAATPQYGIAAGSLQS